MISRGLVHSVSIFFISEDFGDFKVNFVKWNVIFFVPQLESI